MSVLKIRDKNGKFISIFTIKGDKGDKGDPGEIDQTLLDSKQDKFATVTHEEQEFAGKITYVTLEGTFYFGNFAYVSETGSLVLTGGCSVADCKICDLKTPTEDTDAANKVYVDTAIGSIETALDSIIAIQEQLIGGAV